MSEIIKFYSLMCLVLLAIFAIVSIVAALGMGGIY
jgi:hypothetical protein